MLTRFILTVLAIFFLSVTPTRAQSPSSDYRIVGYYTSWSLYDRQYFVTDIPADQLTHINYAFANISQDGECAIGDSYADTEFSYPGDPESADYLGNFRQLNVLKQAHPHLQTLISVGGWTWSGRFSDIALTPESRAQFARSCVDFMTRYGFDGIDLDWEYPTGSGNVGNTERPEDPENFVSLLTEFRTQLDARGHADGRTYLLTIAASAGRSGYEPLDWMRIHPSLDFINVMTYDMSGPWSDVTGHQAPLYDSLLENPPEETSTDTALRDYLALGVPADKLVMGVPFYGRGFAGVADFENGLHQPYNGLPDGTWEAGNFDYRDLAQHYIGSLTRFWDERALVPYLYDAANGTMITYDDPESLTLKAAYVRDGGFGGVMFWELSADTADHRLLTALYDAG